MMMKRFDQTAKPSGSWWAGYDRGGYRCFPRSGTAVLPHEPALPDSLDREAVEQWLSS